METGTKRCSHCGLDKSLDEFYHGRKKGRWYYSPRCKQCERKRMRDSYKDIIPKEGDTYFMRGMVYVKTGQCYRLLWTDEMLYTLRAMREGGATYKSISQTIGPSPESCRAKYMEIKNTVL